MRDGSEKMGPGEEGQRVKVRRQRMQRCPETGIMGFREIQILKSPSQVHGD